MKQVIKVENIKERLKYMEISVKNYNIYTWSWLQKGERIGQRQYLKRVVIESVISPEKFP